MSRFDLHTHSTASDGILKPENLVSRAKSKGVDVLALTDHDTLLGIATAASAASAAGLTFIPGIELSSQWGGRGIHILGLNINPAHSAMLAACEHQREVREQRAVRIAEKLAKCGIEAALQGAKSIAGAAVVGRPHFARYLQQAGYVSSFEQAFKKYLGAGRAGDIKELWPSMAQVVTWVRQAGGTAVLAHPCKYKLTRTKLIALLDDFCACGGQGLEIISGAQPPQQTQNLAAMARRFNLHVSCGSDFHTPDQPWHELGAFADLPQDTNPVWTLWEAV